MPTYFAGRVTSSGSIAMGGGTLFTATRLSLGLYRLDFPKTASGRFLMTVVTPWGTAAIARIVNSSKSAVDGTHLVQIEMRDAAGALVDAEFTFITLERS
jgi:hypothetical protein